jgi:glycerophosphoryl diester phosphodiesterase
MQIIGHRGARDLAPENTVAGIKFALLRQVDWVEFDIHCTKDNKIIVVHDSLVDFIRRKRLVRSCTYNELKERAAAIGEPIPTLSQALRAIGDKAKVLIHVKDIECAPQVVEIIEEQVGQGRSYADFLFGASFARTLRLARRLNGRLRLCYIHEYAHAALPFWFLTVRSVKLTAVAFWSYAVPKRAIDMAKKRGLWTIVYTVNDHPLANKFERWGVDAIITDRPQEFLFWWPMIWRWYLAAALLLFLLCVGLWLWLR